MEDLSGSWEFAYEEDASVAHLLNLDLDVVLVDTTSPYWDVDVPDEFADLQDKVDDDGVSRPVEQGKRGGGWQLLFAAAVSAGLALRQVRSALRGAFVAVSVPRRPAAGRRSRPAVTWHAVPPTERRHR
jgi:hypothetical protein